MRKRSRVSRRTRERSAVTRTTIMNRNRPAREVARGASVAGTREFQWGGRRGRRGGGGGNGLSRIIDHASEIARNHALVSRGERASLDMAEKVGDVRVGIGFAGRLVAERRTKAE